MVAYRYVLIDNRTYLVDHTYNELAFLLAEEFPRCLVRAVWKVNKQEVACSTKHTSNDAFNDEDPPPASIASDAIHLHDAIRQYT